MCRKTFLFFSFFLSLVSLSHAQLVEQCTADAFRNNSLIDHPELANIRATTNQIISEYELSGVNSRELLIIPVVFHIVYYAEVENVTNQQVFSQVAALNRDFRKKNANFTKVHEDFKKVSADVEIEFCLAGKDPFGNETSGITRTQTPYSKIGRKINAGDGRPSIFYSSLGGKDAWDTEKYLNIWVCKIGDNILGRASFPGTAIADEDGVLIDYEAFGSIGTAKSPNHLGKTLSHEIGHYLNLEHVWGNIIGDCTIDDGIEDTPFQERPTSGCPFERRVSCGSFDMFNDYMDYSTDECLAMFSNGQKNRMRATLETVRKELLNSNVCNKIIVESPLDDIVLRPNPANDELLISLEETNIFEVSITIYNVFGQVILTEKTAFFPGDYLVDVSFFPEGIYFVELSSSDNQLVRKLIVHHKGK